MTVLDLTPVEFKSHTLPVGGFSILKSIPEGPIKAEGFCKGSKEKLDNDVIYIKTKWKQRTEVLQQWDEFVAQAPASDDVNDWAQYNELKIPFQDTLFGSASIHYDSPAVKRIGNCIDVRTEEAQDTVKRSKPKLIKTPAEKKKRTTNDKSKVKKNLNDEKQLGK